MEENEKENFFFDKRDANYTAINSDFKFLDVFGDAAKKTKNIIIPETILIQAGKYRPSSFQCSLSMIRSIQVLAI